ncbi:MAG: DUF503 domain-containing protein [Nitrospinota bacterium]
MAAVGLLTLDLHIPASRSLKDKRQVVKSIVMRLRNRHNVSVAEVDCHDLWQRCQLGVSAVSGDGRHLNQQLQRVLQEVEAMHLAELVDYEIEIL